MSETTATSPSSCESLPLRVRADPDLAERQAAYGATDPAECAKVDARPMTRTS